MKCLWVSALWYEAHSCKSVDEEVVLTMVRSAVLLAFRKHHKLQQCVCVGCVCVCVGVCGCGCVCGVYVCVWCVCVCVRGVVRLVRKGVAVVTIH